MQLVAGDGGALGDVAQRHLDVELGQRLLHQPRVGHQLLLRLGGLDGRVRVLQEIQRRQLVIADHGRGGNGNGLGFPPLGHCPGAVNDFRLGGRPRRRRLLGGFVFFRFLRVGLDLPRLRRGTLADRLQRLTQNLRGGCGTHFASRDHDFLFRRLRFPRRLGGRGLLHLGGAGFGLRHAQVAHRRLRHRATVRAEAGLLDFLLQLAFFLFQLARAPLQFALFRRLARGGRLLAPGPRAGEPVAEPEIGQEQEADQVEGGVHDGRAGGAERPKPVVIKGLPQPAAGAGRVDRLPQRLQPGRGVHQVQHAGQGRQQHARPQAVPHPTTAQVRRHPRHAREAEQPDHQREGIRAGAEQEEKAVRQMRAEGADPIVGWLVRRTPNEAEVVAVKGNLRHQQQQRGGQQRDADDLREAVR